MLLREDIELATLIHRGAWLRVAVISVIKPLSYWIMGLGYRQSSSLILLRIPARVALALGLVWKGHSERERLENQGPGPYTCVRTPALTARFRALCLLPGKVIKPRLKDLTVMFTLLATVLKVLMVILGCAHAKLPQMGIPDGARNPGSLHSSP